MKKLNYSIVVPIFNEAGNINELYRRVSKEMQKTGHDFEFIFVNDGSSDNSLEILEALNKTDKRVKTVSLSRNFGQQAAVSAGLENASGDIVATIDADLQDPPELLPAFFAKIDQGFDVVYGVSKTRKDPIIRKLLFNLYYLVMDRLSSYPLPKHVGIFAVMRRPVVETLLSVSEHNRWLPALRSWVGFKQTGIEYEKPKRFSGKPPQTFGKLFTMGLDALFSFSYIPLRLATFLGILVTILAFFIGLDVVYQKYFAHTAITGWSGPMLSIVIIGGAQLIILGIIGEYLGRIYDEVKRRPYYVVSGKVGF